MRRNIAALLDGYGWLPLSKDVDEAAIRKRIQTEVFPDEFQQVLGK